MSSLVLFENDTHKNILLEDFSSGGMVQANQHLIIHKGQGAILDPGGHKIYGRVLTECSSLLGSGTLRFIFLSHQDPDIVAAVNGWLMTTDADAYASQLWVRFIPHFGVDSLVADRLKPVPDEGTVLDLAGAKLVVIPAHFMHSPGNFQLYDPIAKILYTGDLGASMVDGYRVVKDFDAHVKTMEGFHRRYMASKTVMTAWAKMARGLDIETIAPQHGAVFQGRDMVKRFIDWCDGFECGVDVMMDIYRVPSFG
jgi:flavorubredoxin